MIESVCLSVCVCQLKTLTVINESCSTILSLCSVRESDPAYIPIDTVTTVN